MIEIVKYPRTQHLQGSKLQPGDEDLSQVKFASLKDQYIVIEEKIDGANSAFSFDSAGDLILQCRGHALVGGAKEKQFNQFKTWAAQHKDALLERFEDRYIVYGEWMRAKHTVFYDALPHLFFEFDIWDKKEERFLSTVRRRELLSGLPIEQVPVLYEGITPESLKDVMSLVKRSSFKTERWRENLVIAATQAGLDPAKVVKETDKSDLMEGLYFKLETDEHTVGRLKWVRRDFVQHILEGGKHWSERPIVENTLNQGVDLYAMPYLTESFNM